MYRRKSVRNLADKWWDVATDGETESGIAARRSGHLVAGDLNRIAKCRNRENGAKPNVKEDLIMSSRTFFLVATLGISSPSRRHRRRFLIHRSIRGCRYHFDTSLRVLQFHCPGRFYLFIVQEGKDKDWRLISPRLIISSRLAKSSRKLSESSDCSTHTSCQALSQTMT